MSDSNTIKLRSSDGNSFTTSLKCVKMCGTLKEMLLTLDSVDIDEIPLHNVDSITLEKVIRWLEHHKNEPQPSSEDIKDKTAETIDDWDESFLDVELNQLYEMITAANYLEIPQLLWLTTRKIAYMIKGKSPEEIRTIFNIENDWTPQELEAVQKENQWCEEK
ncbi:S-phase kinase-associated protein 1-like [Chironomus tepperi]|uniref:S-phase kinase-associated protein 1-like n=1 Tax=Chironomus tepperi TaxID=113505 RepID=UPI00391F3642